MRTSGKPKAQTDRPLKRREMRDFGFDFPNSANQLLEHFIAMSARPYLSMTVPGLPETTNQMYNVVKGQWMLSANALRFKRLVAGAIRDRGADWLPTGMAAVVIFLLSPRWVSKKHTIREMDGDNRHKSLLDAIEKATGVSDAHNWEIHVYKVPSPVERTAVYLFDLGEEYQWFP